MVWANALLAVARCAKIASATWLSTILVANDARPSSLRSVAVASCGIMQRQPVNAANPNGGGQRPSKCSKGQFRLALASLTRNRGDAKNSPDTALGDRLGGI
jgi:hypothetical protein